ncbi:MAG: hypothetical protein RLZZ455_836 [Candidatus Parcubacteria bacterium]|jgi:protein-disulfide isomerase
MPRAVKPTKKLHSETPSESIASTKKSSEYLEIRLPKLRFQDSPLSPLWVILLLLFAFLLGMTTTKLQYLEKGTTTTTQKAAGETQGEITMDTVRQWAKDLRLDSNKFNQCIADEKYKDRISKDVSDAISASAEATPTFYVNGTQIIGAVPFEQFKKTFDALLAGENVEGEKITVELGGLPMLGKDDAPLTMVEFSDLQCPFCLRFFTETFPQIKKEYIDTGKVKFYFRHLPLTQLHPMAMPFAHAAECANEQGKFWEMHDKIYNEQTS